MEPLEIALTDDTGNEGSTRVDIEHGSASAREGTSGAERNNRGWQGVLPAFETACIR